MANDDSTVADERGAFKVDVSEARSVRCLNCSVSLTGPFCSVCGQRDVPPYPTLRELSMDAVSEFSGWDGRLAKTLRELIRRPGMLTQEFLEGRRVRYISPLRLYLMASLIYFLLAAAAPDIRLKSGKTEFLGLQVGTSVGTGSVGSRPERVANAATEAIESQNALSETEREAALKDIAHAPAFMQPLLRRAVEDPSGLKRRMFETIPRMLFVLLPIFAGILALFYRRRKYPEHLYFAIHLHAFIFLALATAELLKFTRLPVLVALGSALAVLSIPIYATQALRRVYGGSLRKTLVKELGIAAIYGLTAIVAFVVTIYWVSITA
ncbi:MAG TPA: DUF3667 domain-containing protein [Gemmatimonadaceae bacterium]|nr:DUF3667 domain-containing protein [Gemmatimonadaceae bacterium]